MDYIEQLLDDLDNGAQLIIRCVRTEHSLRFEAFVIDGTGKGYIETERATLNLALGKLDELADEWLRNNEQDELA